jgi:hypothetical protein
MSVNSALKCFKDNLELFSDPKSQTEKFNLYQGLHCLAEAVRDIDLELQNIKNQIKDLEAKLS